jgi:hypothetical protein
MARTMGDRIPRHAAAADRRIRDVGATAPTSRVAPVVRDQPFRMDYGLRPVDRPVDTSIVLLGAAHQLTRDPQGQFRCCER